MQRKKKAKFPVSSVVSYVVLSAILLTGPSSVFGELLADDVDLSPKNERLIKQDKKRPGYTINFNNVSIKEYLKFISKVADLNFIYEETDLDFNVTIVSEEPTDLANVLGALVQVLRIHGFSLIDDGVNLVINKADTFHQIATVVSDEHPYTASEPPMIVTRVFKIKNANPASVGSLLEPMLAPTAQLEVSRESRHLIVTDSAVNIDKIADLLLTLDAPNSPLEIDAYTAEHNNVQNLIVLATQIVTPLSEGNPLIMVAQDQTNTIFVVSTPFLIEKTLSILQDLDSKPLAQKERILTGNNVLLYKIQYRSASAIEKALSQISQNLEQLGYAPEGFLETLETAKYIPETHSMLFTGDSIILKKIEDIIANIDAPGKPLPGSHNSSFFLYKPKYLSAEELSTQLESFAKDLDDSHFADSNLISTIKTLKIVDSTNSILLTGDEQSIKEIQGIITSLDVPTETQLERLGEKFLIYKIKNGTEEQIAKSLNNLADNLEESKYPDRALIDAIDSMKWIKETNSLVFTGTESSLKQISDILSTFDIPIDQSQANLERLPPSSEFYMYTPTYVKGPQLLAAVENLAASLQESGLANPMLLRSLESARWIPSSSSIVFTGSTEILSRIKSLMPTIDVLDGAHRPTLYIYQTKFIAAENLTKALQNLANNLPQDDEVAEIIETMKTAEDSNSLVFKGPTTAIDKLKELLTVMDSKTQADLASYDQLTYIIYRLKNVSGQMILQDLDSVAKKLSVSNSENKDVIKAITSIEWIKSTNSLYVSGTPEALQKVKDLIDEFDIQRLGQSPTSYFIYKPIALSPQQVLDQIDAIAQGLKQSGLANSDLLNSIASAKYVEANESLVFTGTEPAIKQVKEILATIESGDASSIQQFGKKTFLIYRLKYVPAQQLLSHLRAVAGDLLANKADEQSLVESIETARFIPDTNTIIFTGAKDVLQEVQATAEKFDTKSLVPTFTDAPEGYFVYQPISLTPQELITIMHDFEQQLLHSGVDEPDLFQTINNMKTMEKTSSIVVAGKNDTIKKVEELLKKFDVPSTSGGAPGIDTFDDISFLIYKLKYHEGTEIEDALKKIAVDVEKSKSGEKNAALVDAIKSIQWIQVTNSLIGTGTPQTLMKLKQLIENIDIPLEQIFIEVLVLETDLTSVLNFGLRWGTQGKYRNKLGYATGAFPQYPTNSDGSSSDPFSSFNTALAGISATTTPTGGNVPFSTGFGLGVIGDLIYHKGQSYTALGSLIDALREDGDSTIVLSQKVVTQDNKPTTIFTGDNIPFTGSNVQNAGTNATVITSNLEYRDIGVSLSLTPRVGDDGVITLDIDQEITEDLNQGSDSSASLNGSASGGSITSPNVFGISTSKTSMQTQATVPDRHFLVLSGVMRNQKVKERTGIPCLGGLPIIGAAFSKTSTQIVKKNVIIFVRPEIIKNFKNFREITERQEDLFRSQAQEEDFDKGLELVQTPDDN